MGKSEVVNKEPIDNRTLGAVTVTLFRGGGIKLETTGKPSLHFDNIDGMYSWTTDVDSAAEKLITKAKREMRKKET